ncbi:MAG: nitronate monooxygenase [Actinomycetota bacterium]
MEFSSLVECDVPIQLAGMGIIGADVALPAAVSSAGGFGMLGAGGLSVDFIEKLIDEMIRVAGESFGINFLAPFLDRESVALASRKCRVVEFFYADPDRGLIAMVHQGGALAGWQVGSLLEAQAAAEAGCDYVVVQGCEAGGHVRGGQPLGVLLQQTVEASLGVPIVAAGGIATADAVAGAIRSGASAVRVGTRFLAAHESFAHPDYVDALLRATAADTTLTQTFSLGWPDAPHRVLRSAIDAMEATNEEFVGTFSAAHGSFFIPRGSSIPPTRTTQGNIGAMALYAGTSVEATNERQSAAQIVKDLCRLL